MQIDDFERWWQDQERAGLERMIGAVGASSDTADHAVCHLRACTEVQALLRRSGRQRLGCQAAHRAHVAVVDACRRTGLFESDREGSVRLARAAGDAARVLVCEARLPAIDELLAPFRSELPLDLAS
jgi:hypothetical protein